MRLKSSKSQITMKHFWFLSRNPSKVYLWDSSSFTWTLTVTWFQSLVKKILRKLLIAWKDKPNWSSSLSKRLKVLEMSLKHAIAASWSNKWDSIRCPCKYLHLRAASCWKKGTQNRTMTSKNKDSNGTSRVHSQINRKTKS